MSKILEQVETRRRLLSPIERTSEVWFGLIMVLTLTCSLSVAQAGHADVHAMLVNALGCNLAWGIIDGFMYLAAAFSEHGQVIALRRDLRAATTDDERREIFERVLPSRMNEVMTPEERKRVAAGINRLPDLPAAPWLTREDWLGAIAVFLLVFLSTLPVVLPFVFIPDPMRAMRISNGVAIVLLFATGYKFGQYSGYRPWGMGAAVVVFAGVLVAITMRLGG